MKRYIVNYKDERGNLNVYETDANSPIEAEERACQKKYVYSIVSVEDAHIETYKGADIVKSKDGHPFSVIQRGHNSVMGNMETGMPTLEAARKFIDNSTRI